MTRTDAINHLCADMVAERCYSIHGPIIAEYGGNGGMKQWETPCIEIIPWPDILQPDEYEDDEKEFSGLLEEE